jgi:hypothetical protein
LLEVRTDVKINKSNYQIFCRFCIEELKEKEGRNLWFLNKKDLIIQHLKKCSNFLDKIDEVKKKFLGLLQSNISNLIPQKRKCKYLNFNSFIYNKYILI